MKINQCSLILNHMMRYGSINARTAKKRYKIGSLSARVMQLRKMGFAIKTGKDGYHLSWWIPRGKDNEETTQLELFNAKG